MPTYHQRLHLAGTDRSGAPPGGAHTHGGGPARAAQWAEPEDVATAPDSAPLTAAQVARFHAERYLVLDGLFPPELIAQALAVNTADFPTPSADKPAADLQAARSTHALGSREFPFDEEHDAYNQLTLHPRALRCVAQLLGTADLRVTRSNTVLTKYGPSSTDSAGRDLPIQGFGRASGDQNLHQDYGNNTMLVPSSERPDCVAGICYLNHVEDSGGATGIVPYHPSLPKYGLGSETGANGGTA